MTAPSANVRPLSAEHEVNRWMSDVPPWSWLVASPGNEAPQ